MSRVYLKSFLAVLLLFFGTSAFAGTRDPSEFPLQVRILETHWNQTGYGTTGFGRGNVEDSDTIQGFDYTFDCGGPFNASQGDSFYIGRWKKTGTRLSILTVEIGNSNKTHECELRTTLIDGVYGMKDGHLATYSPEQYEEILDTRKKLAEAKEPPDTDPAHFPLSVTILEAQWEKSPAGGVVGGGRGNIKNGSSVMAFEFSGLCLAGLQVTPTGATYKAKWKQEPTELVVLTRSISDSRAHQCTLKAEIRPTHVYLRNSNSGLVSTLTQDEFKLWVEKKRAAQEAAKNPPVPNMADTKATPAPEFAKKKSALTNGDIISMISNGLSTEVILAKLSASECAFDTSPDGLKQLKSGKVPDAVVIEMIKKSSR